MPDTATAQPSWVAGMTNSWKVRSCARCDHRSDQHLWNGSKVTDVKPPVPCSVDGCSCEAWTFEPKKG